jgi:hypothetical protein
MSGIEHFVCLNPSFLTLRLRFKTKSQARTSGAWPQASEHSEILIMLVLVDALADAVLAPVQLSLFGLG